jgi:sterol desaturase/sphingolipid hydroxylase (fatty acid hydroxylase superfamily)
MKNKLIIGLISLVFAAGAIISMAPQAYAIDVDMTSDLESVGQAGFGEDLDSGDALPVRIGNIIQVILGLLGVILVLIIIYAGFLWMTAGGEEKNVDKAKDWIKNAVIGLVIIMSAYAITSYVITRLVENLS